MPVQKQVQVPMIQKVQKTVEVPQMQHLGLEHPELKVGKSSGGLTNGL